MYSYITSGYALAAILLYLGNMFLVPLLGIRYFLGISAGLNLLNIPIAWKCLISHPKWKSVITTEAVNNKLSNNI